MDGQGSQPRPFPVSRTAGKVRWEGSGTMLEQIVRSWAAVLTQPAVTTFDRERAAAAMDRTLVGILLSGLIAGIGSAIGQLVFRSFLIGPFGDQGLEPDSSVFGPVLGAGLSIVFGPLVVLIGFFGWAGILFLVAKALGGPGDFVVHSYLLSLAVAPIAALGGLLGIIPCLAILAGLPLCVYQYALTTLALQSSHGFSVGRAVAVWLIPLLAVFFLASCLLVVALAFIFAVVEGAG